MEEFICPACGTIYPVTERFRWKCDCGAPLELVMESEFNPNNLQGRPHSLWRYREALPDIPEEDIVGFGEGFTPLTPFETSWGKVHVKLDFLMPSGSFKDRGAAVLISKVKQLGVEEVVIDSSGNAAASMSCYAAKAGIRCRVFVPASTSAGKLVQMRYYGAEIVAVPGSREDTANAVLEAAQDTYYASHYWNPYFFQGTKTFAFEEIGRAHV
jgi:threonine synthase